MAVEPFGPVQDDLRAGVVGSLVAATFGGKTTPGDLFPSLSVPKPVKAKQSMAHWKAQAQAIARSTRGRKRGN